jgi:hypothetical protein
MADRGAASVAGLGVATVGLAALVEARDPRGARTVTTVLVIVASRKIPTAANSMMMMPETSGLIWGRMGARAKTTATTQTA